MADSNIQLIENKLRKRGQTKLRKVITSIAEQLETYINEQYNNGNVAQAFIRVINASREDIFKELSRKYEQRTIDAFLQSVDIEDVDGEDVPNNIELGPELIP